MPIWKKKDLMSFQKTSYYNLKNKNISEIKKNFYNKVLNKAKFKLMKLFKFENENYNDVVWVYNSSNIAEIKLKRFLKK